ncbi:Xylanase inhibitor, N-terminal [Dillenia turbinata]|uniref:Xylanase inhibitor, N-terminal n=1 Tax=Dillenia turbinata TaxID=194707 RepID=A0AAN8W6U3_9MAGN
MIPLNKQVDVNSLIVQDRTRHHQRYQMMQQIALNSFDTGRSSTVSHLACLDKTCPRIATSGTSENYLYDQPSLDLFSGNGLTHLSASVVFGCSTYQYGTLKSTTMALDGIIGLGPGDLSMRGQLSSQGITPNVFSHYLKGEGAGGGVLVFGEIMRLNKIIAAAPPSLTPFPFGGLQCYQISTSFNFGNSLNKIFPSISLNFAGGANLILSAEDYSIPSVISTDMWCLGILKSDTGITVLGSQIPD